MFIIYLLCVNISFVTYIRCTLSKLDVCLRNCATEAGVFSTNLFAVRNPIPLAGCLLNCNLLIICN
ncbi:hypothetical protein HanRHA438_Chr01g0028541 [Helianthus annuus]|nr:hypothetical protein HanRHA438_Chr01g0028541 [Helianthus annuus]